MPSSPNYKRDFKREYEVSQSSKEQKQNRALRNKARRAAIRKHGKAALSGKDVDHKVPLRSGGSGSLKNTRIRSIKSNRSANGHSKKG